MKRKTLILALILEAALIAGLVYLSRQYPAWFTSVWSIPMEQIAGGLKALSGTGTFGNGLALAILAGIALVPVIFALRYPRGRETLAERITLTVLAVVIPIVLWNMVHPGNMRQGAAAGSDAFLQVVRAALSLILWSVVILFIVLRLIRLFRAGKREQLLRYFRILLAVSCMAFTAELAVTLMNAALAPAADACLLVTHSRLGIPEHGREFFRRNRFRRRKPDRADGGGGNFAGNGVVVDKQRLADDFYTGIVQRNRCVQGKVLKLRGKHAVRRCRGAAKEHHNSQDQGRQAFHNVPSFR